MEKHTPGPWQYGQNAVGQMVIFGNHPGIPHQIEVAVMDERKRRKPEVSQIRDNNAALIAAAPDLLAACVDFVSWVDGRIEADPAWFDKQAPFFQQAYHAQCAAIAKATGI